jgi:hypothetical protein
MGAVLRAVPLLGFVLVLANLLALLGEGFDTELLKFTMTSGVDMRLDAGDLVVISGLFVDHVASLAVFVVALVEFLLLPRFAHGAFLALLVMCLIDVIAGFTVTLSSARRDFNHPA